MDIIAIWKNDLKVILPTLMCKCHLKNNNFGQHICIFSSSIYIFSALCDYEAEARPHAWSTEVFLKIVTPAFAQLSCAHVLAPEFPAPPPLPAPCAPTKISLWFILNAFLLIFLTEIIITALPPKPCMI
jgi:hypothetical protein